MKKLLSMLLCLMACHSIVAAPIDKATALQSATAFMKQKGWNVGKQPRMAPRKTPTQTTGNDYVYLFNSDNGFVIVSGDDQTEPILGYVEGIQFNEDEMPENMMWWIGEYERQIKYLQDHNIQQVQYILDKPAINPLTTSDWNQSEPYNNMCPEINGKRCPTGCLATALAQVMYYHKWPEEATTEIPAYRTSTNRIQMPKLAATTFDWSNMKNSYNGYSNTAQKNAVATLMLYCGQANYMDYNTTSSGASEFSVVNSLVNYFGYDESAQLTGRTDITTADWENMVYFELANNRPVFYCGQSTGGGHAFVCDGYDGNGLFHISWGWGYNSYFNSWCRLSILNPNTTTAVGASTTEDGFTYGQSIVRGIRRPGDAGEVAPLMLQASLEDYSWANGQHARVYYVSNLAKTYQFDIALATLDDNNNPTIISIETNKNITPIYLDWNYHYSDYNLNASQFSGNGTYRLAMLCRKSGTTEWAPMYSYDIEYIKATVNGNSVNLSMVYNDGTPLVAENMQFTGEVSTKDPCEFTAEIRNNGTEEYMGELYCFQSKTSTKGTVVSVAGAYVEPGTAEKVYFYFKPLAEEDLNVWICTDENGQHVIGTFTLAPTPKDVYDISMVSSTVVTDPLNITVTLKNTSENTYNRNITATIYRADTEQPTIRKVTKTVEVPAGGTADVVYTSLPGVDKSYNYYLKLSYYENSKTTEMTELEERIYVIFNDDPTGIQSIEKSEQNHDYYNLAGQKVSGDYKGIVIRNGKKIVR